MTDETERNLHFEQVPVELVKKLVEGEKPKPPGEGVKKVDKCRTLKTATLRQGA
jgi:hypothetical protein